MTSILKRITRNYGRKGLEQVKVEQDVAAKDRDQARIDRALRLGLLSTELIGTASNLLSANYRQAINGHCPYVA